MVAHQLTLRIRPCGAPSASWLRVAPGPAKVAIEQVAGKKQVRRANEDPVVE
ncbi:hypothetical protein [Cerasicoccus frondis]|uniref:hypothetical protein n=1 Tax=Cerasicoccus frondis TaxID=490090 RepID=UPI0028525C5C|nr:hypothetical protein [Cerasicoccus frondis]